MRVIIRMLSGSSRNTGSLHLLVFMKMSSYCVLVRSCSYCLSLAFEIPSSLVIVKMTSHCRRISRIPSTCSLRSSMQYS